jgi:hypothetical protein
MPDNRPNPDDQEQIGRSVNEEATGAADEDFEDVDDAEDDDQEENDVESAE